MQERYGIVDVMNLAYRAYHVTDKKAREKYPGVILQTLLRMFRKLEEDLCLDTMVFCFDGGYEYRRKILPEYKEHRKKVAVQNEESELVPRDLFFSDIDSLRRVILPDLGVVNIFWQPGYEADDLIAACTRTLNTAKKVYLISSDEDLYQLIEGNRVVVYNPGNQKFIAEQDFSAAHYDIPPALFASVKAWAGCPSDNIPGLPRVGVRRAAQFVSGQMKDCPCRRIILDNIEVFNRNIQLTKLPAPGTMKCPVTRQEAPIDWDGKINTMQQLSNPKGLR